MATLTESMELLKAILARGCTPEDQRRYVIEHTALMDLYEGHPFNDQRWNITEAYIYREAYMRGSLQLELEGKGKIDYIPTKEAS